MKRFAVVRLQIAISIISIWAASPALGTERPNVILINADDLGYGDLSCYGATKIRTPNIDRLAREGRMFGDAHSGSAVCTPSRYAMLTGRYAWRKEIYGPIFHEVGLIIDPNRLTLADLFKNSDYATACIGKWHLGFGEGRPNWNGDLKPGPLEVGFDYYFGVPIVNSHPPFVYVENHRVVGLDPTDPLILNGRQERQTMPFPEKRGLDTFGGAKAAHALYDDERVCTTLTEKAVDWISQDRDRPFFLYFATTNIHHPFTPHSRFKGTSDSGIYGDFAQELDWAVGEILDTLDELELTSNTLVIFTSDNGGMLNQGGKRAWELGHRLNGDLLGFKFDVWEGGHRVPFLARWPGHVPPGTRSAQLLSQVDLLATFAAILGQTLGPNEGPDSFNLLPAFTGDPLDSIRDHLLLTPLRAANRAIRSGPWIYIGAQGPGGFGANRPFPGEEWFNNALMWHAWTKQINSDISPDGTIQKNAPPAQLYNLETDPSQKRNVYHENPEIVERLERMLEHFLNKNSSVSSPFQP